MDIEEYYKKQIFGSLDKSKLPGPLTEYRCELVIEEYANRRQELYLSFIPDKTPLSPFKVKLDSFMRPKNIIHYFQIKEAEK